MEPTSVIQVIFGVATAIGILGGLATLLILLLLRRKDKKD
jgi:hypothetical protein